jgi:hypothetical protein
VKLPAVEESAVHGDGTLLYIDFVTWKRGYLFKGRAAPIRRATCPQVAAGATEAFEA